MPFKRTRRWASPALRRWRCSRSLFPNPYYIHLLETIMIYAIVLFGLDIVVGYTGQVSLGHAGLFGIGAYTAGVLVTKLGTPLLVTLLGAIGVTALFGAHAGAAGVARHRPVPGDGDAGVRHHHPDPHQRDDVPHRRARWASS